MPDAIKLLKRFSILCFFIFFLFNSTNAQTTKVNELLSQLKKSDPDTIQIKVMRKLSAAYTTVDPAKKLYYANQYRLLAEKNGIDSLVASAYLDMGIYFGITSNLDSALYYFKLGNEKAKASNYLNGIARSYVNIGFVYDRLDKKKEAVKCYENSLKIYRKLNFKKGINQCIINLGSIYFDLGEYKVADNYFREVLESVKETPNDEIGMANALFSLGNSNRKLGNQQKSLDYFQKSLAIREKIGDLNGIALSNWGIGMVYTNLKKYDKALKYLEIALKKNQALKNTYQEAIVLMSISRAYMGLKDYKKAQEKGDIAIKKAKHTDSKGLISQGLELLIDINKAQKNYADVLRYQADYKAVNDSLSDTKTKKEVILSDLYRINADNKNLEKDNKKIVAKNSDYRIVISIITILSIVLGIVLALYYKRNLEKKATNILLQKQKQEISDANEELAALNEELISQMDIVSAQNLELEKLNKVKTKFFSIVSHDLRGPLITIKTLLDFYRNGDLTQSEWHELLNQLEYTTTTTTAFLDNLLEWSKNQLDGMVVKPTIVQIHHIINENIQLMDSQIKLKALKVVNKIDTDITVYADPNMTNIIFRNLLSNAVKFCSTGDDIIFEAKLNENKVICSITDTGSGISDTEKENLFNLMHATTTGTAGEKGYHIGLILCKDMALQNNGNIQVESKLGEGTTFYVTLPAKAQLT